jgi:predicted nucleic acid-binding protein
MEQREVVRQALEAEGVPEAVAVIASELGVPTALPMTAETMKLALVTADARLMARALEATEKKLQEAGPRDDPEALRKVRAEVERRAPDYTLPKLKWEKRRKDARNTPPDMAEQWAVLEGAMLMITFREQAERDATQYGVPALAQHFMAMRAAIVAEYSPRLMSIEQPRRVPGADAAWAALANSHDISVATLRQRGKEFPKLLEELEGQKQREEKTDRLAPKKPPLRDRRKRSQRQLTRKKSGSSTAGGSADGGAAESMPRRS